MWQPSNIKAGGELEGGKALTVALWLFVGSLLTLSVLFLLRPSYWQQLVGGTLVVVVGSAGSQLLPGWKDRKWLKWVRAVCIAIIVAAGALLTTHGWNMRDNHLRYRGVLKALAREWKLNDERNREIKFNRHRVREDNFLKRRPFPVPTHSYIEQAMDITAFGLPSPEPSFLQLWLFVYTVRIDHLAIRLQGINQFASQKDSYTQAFQQTFGEGDAYSKYLEAHREVERRLREAHPWLFEEIDNFKIEWARRESD